MHSILDRVSLLLPDSFPSPVILAISMAVLPHLRSLHLAAPPDPLGLELEGVVLVCDSSGDRVVRFYDADGSGIIEDSDAEIGVYYDDSGVGPARLILTFPPFFTRPAVSLASFLSASGMPFVKTVKPNFISIIFRAISIVQGTRKGSPPRSACR